MIKSVYRYETEILRVWQAQGFILMNLSTFTLLILRVNTICLAISQGQVVHLLMH